jgi:hypothetical protein
LVDRLGAGRKPQKGVKRLRVILVRYGVIVEVCLVEVCLVEVCLDGGLGRCPR